MKTRHSFMLGAFTGASLVAVAVVAIGMKAAPLSTNNPVVSVPSSNSDIYIVALPGGPKDTQGGEGSSAESAIRRYIGRGYRVLGVTESGVYMMRVN